MHYQARLLMPEGRYRGQAVYPTAWQDGECRCFCEKKLVDKAWGFTKLYDGIPNKERAEAASVFTHASDEAMASITDTIMVKTSSRPSSRRIS